MIGSFLLKMADKQVISARSAWYVDKRTLRREFDIYLQLEPNGNELRLMLALAGAFNVSFVFIIHTTILVYRNRFPLNNQHSNLTTANSLLYYAVCVCTYIISISFTPFFVLPVNRRAIVYQQRRFRLALPKISCVSHRQCWVLPGLACAKPGLVRNMFVRKFPKHISHQGGLLF